MCCTKQHIAEIHLFCAAASVDRATSSFHADLSLASDGCFFLEEDCLSVCLCFQQQRGKNFLQTWVLGTCRLAVVLTISIVRSLAVHAVHANGTAELMCDITIDDEVN